MPNIFKTKSEVAYEKLRQEVFNGELKPGDKVIVPDLSKMLGISDIPIREAIKRLETEGFLENTPHVGTIVKKIDMREYIEFFLIRIELESLATKLATQYIQENDLTFLEQKIDEMESALNNNDLRSFTVLHKDFHCKIYNSSPYTYLSKLIVNLWDKNTLVKDVFFIVPQRAGESDREHRQILAAIRSRKAILAGKLVRQQKQRSLNAIIEFMKNKEESTLSDTRLV